MHNYEILNLNDLRKALKEIKLFYNNQSNIHEDNLINITLNIQNIEPIGPFNFHTLGDNITEEYYNGMLYTIKLILATIYKLVNENLTITLSCHLINKLPSKKNQKIKAKTTKFINIIKELQQELHIQPKKFFLQIKNPYDSDSFQETISLLQNKNLQGLKISGGLILQEAFICRILTTIKEQYLEELIKTNILKKLHSIEINFINLNNYENLFNCYSEDNKVEIILEREKFQLLNIFNMIKILINKYSNLTKFDVCFAQYNLNNPIKFQKTFNLLPKEYTCLQPIYNDLVQNSVLMNIKNKLENYLSKINNLDNSIENLNQICKQENIINDELLICKLQQNTSKMLIIQKDITEKFIKYTNILNQEDDSSVFYYFARFYLNKKEFKKAYEYLELVNQKSISFNAANNLNLFLYLNNYATHLENLSSQITESAENQMFLFSQLKHYTPEPTSSTPSKDTSSSSNNVVKKQFTYQPLLPL